MATIDTSTQADATAHGNQRKLDRCSNGVLVAMFDRDGDDGELWYSTDQGTTWSQDTGATIAGFADGSIFVATDGSTDRMAIVWKQSGAGGGRTDGYLYFVWAVPNAGRTVWTLGTPRSLTNDAALARPDCVAFKDGTLWNVPIVASAASPGNFGRYTRIVLSAADAINGSSREGLAATNGDFGEISTAKAVNTRGGLSIDFHHTGDGKTVQGGTPHLYIGILNSIPSPGVEFRKAVYSAGSWTFNTIRSIDATRYANTDEEWLNCLFDGTRVILFGQVYDGAVHDLYLWDRDVADTTTTARPLATALSTANKLSFGSGSYDASGNVYLFGNETASASGSRDQQYRKWTRSGATLGALVVLDSTVGLTPGTTVKRGYGGTRLDLLHTDGTASPYNVVYTSAVSFNAAPNAPTLVSPINNDAVDRTAAIVLTAAFSDPDVGDQLSGFEVEYRTQAGTGLVQPGEQAASGQTGTYSISPTLAAGGWEWRSRARDNAGALGAWSAWEQFTAASPPAAPIITLPTDGATVATNPFTVEWTHGTQEAYQVRTVADLAGSPNTAVVYEDTGIVESAGARSVSVDFDVNNRDEHVQVRSRGAGLWSTWDSHAVEVSYTAPASPTSVVDTDPSGAALLIAADHPTPSGGQPTVTSHDVLRQESTDDGETWSDAVRVAAALDPADTYTDWRIASRRLYRYAIKAYGSNGTTSTSDWT